MKFKPLFVTAAVVSLFFVKAAQGFAQASLQDISDHLNEFSDDMAGALSFMASIGLDWSEPYIGHLAGGFWLPGGRWRQARSACPAAKRDGGLAKGSGGGGRRRRRLETGGAAWNEPPYSAGRRNVTSWRSPFLMKTITTRQLPRTSTNPFAFTLSEWQGRLLSHWRTFGAGWPALHRKSPCVRLIPGVKNPQHVFHDRYGLYL